LLCADKKLARPDENWHLQVMRQMNEARFQLGQIVRHRLFSFRGVIFDVDPQFNNTEEWYNSIPAEVRPRKDQPYYHLLAENDETEYVAYVSEQNLLEDETHEPVRHPQVKDYFTGFDPKKKQYKIRSKIAH
jgi:heat shock protein HspQ